MLASASDYKCTHATLQDIAQETSKIDRINGINDTLHDCRIIDAWASLPHNIEDRDQHEDRMNYGTRCRRACQKNMTTPYLGDLVHRTKIFFNFLMDDGYEDARMEYNLNWLRI